jgi:hypothetical protein
MVYRDDREALVQRLDVLSKADDQNQAMRADIVALRRSLATRPDADPYLGQVQFGPGEVAAYRQNRLEKFPVWAVSLLHLISFGLSSLILFGIQQGNLPRLKHNDPSTAEAIGFQFIPFFNLYWVFFAPMRFCDRVTLQYRLRGLEDGAPKGLTLAAAVCSVVPYLGFIPSQILWNIAACITQHKINRLVDHDAAAGQAPLLIAAR